MARLSWSLGLITSLALAGLVNHATTCCCGDSLVLELILETRGCDAHEHDRQSAQHHPGQVHACYKAGSQAFLTDVDTQPDPPRLMGVASGAPASPGALSHIDPPPRIAAADPPWPLAAADSAWLGRWLL